MVTRPDYEADAVEAARSVLLELTRLLGAYREHIVLVGGWVPELHFPTAQPKHVGSLDIDLALDHRVVTEATYRTIDELLTHRGYERDERQPFIYRRRISVGGREIVVQVDLLAGEYQGTGSSHRTQTVQDVQPRKARGCDLALDMAKKIEVRGRLPNGSEDRETIRVAAIIPFLVMKGMALADRLKEKDAYDIYFCIKNFPGGVEALAKGFRAHASHGLVKEGLGKIADKFASIRAYGPQSVADFEQVHDLRERELLVRDAYEQVDALIKKVSESNTAKAEDGQERIE